VIDIQYADEHPSVVDIYRNIHQVCALRRYEEPLYASSLDLIRDDALRSVVKQILQAYADRDIWEDKDTTSVSHFRTQYEHLQESIRQFIQYSTPEERTGDELTRLTSNRDEARRRLAAVLRQNISDVNQAAVTKRYEYLKNLSEAFDELGALPRNKSGEVLFPSLNTVFTSLDNFVEKLEDWISHCIQSPVSDTNHAIIKFTSALRVYTDRIVACAERAPGTDPTFELLGDLCPIMNTLSSALSREKDFWTRDPIVLFSDLRPDVTHLCRLIRHYATTTMRRIDIWRQEIPQLMAEYMSIYPWLAYPPACEKFYELHKEAKASKKNVKQLTRDLEDAQEENDTILASDIEDRLNRARVDMQYKKQTLSHERARLASVCGEHFPELSSTHPDLFFTFSQVPDVSQGLLVFDRNLDDYSDQVMLSCCQSNIVYKASFAGHSVVLKKYHLSDQSNSLRGLQMEALILSKISTKTYFASVNCTFSDDKSAFIEMPYYANGNLGMFMQRMGSKFSYTCRCTVMRKVCEALEYLHSIDIVHCGLKLANILIDDNACPRIADYDISMTSSERQVATTTSWSRGTIEFLAPEILPPISVPATAASDMYSFGVCLLKVMEKMCCRDAQNGVHVVPVVDDLPLQNILALLLSAEPRARISAVDALKSEFFTSVELTMGEHELLKFKVSNDAASVENSMRSECCRCERVVDISDGVCCEQGHFVCDTCFDKYVWSECMKDISERRWMYIFDKERQSHHFIRRCDSAVIEHFPTLTADDFDSNPWTDYHRHIARFAVKDFFEDKLCIFCPYQRKQCTCEPLEEEIVFRHISPATLEVYKTSRNELIEWRRSHELLLKTQEARELIANISDVDQQAEEARSYIVETINTLKCPRCEAEFDNFGFSAALVCGQCGCNFCSYCVRDCGDDSVSHVVRCPNNVIGSLKVTEGEFKAEQLARQSRMTKEYVKTLPEETCARLGCAGN